MNKLRLINIRLLYFIFIGAFQISTSIGQNVNISVTAAGQENELIRVITYEDQFSKLEKTLSTNYIDNLGSYNFDLETQQTLFSNLAVGLKRGEFYLSPNSAYQFNVLDDTVSRRGSIFDELPLQFTYTADDEGLSEAIGSFNIQYNTFIYQYANKIYHGRDKAFIHDFEDKIDEQFNFVNNTYLNNYIRYSFASLEWTSKMKNNDSIIAEYFIGNPILYNNIQYAEFFTDFFKTYFIADNLFAYHEIISAINEDGGIQAIKALIWRNESFNKDPQLTEMVSILLIAKKYYNPDIKRSKVLDLLMEFESRGEFDKNREVAGNFIKKLQILESGTKAPTFDLMDLNNVTYSLSDFQGKFILLSFIKPNCRICMEYLGQQDELVNKFQGKVENVTIVFGDGFSDVVKYADERDFTWPFLNINNNILLLEAYNIRVYPTYVIINPDGTIAMSTVPMPDENLNLYLNRQIKRYNENSKEENK